MPSKNGQGYRAALEGLAELLYLNKDFYFFSPVLSPGFTVSITFSTAWPVLVAFSSIFCFTTSASLPTPLIQSARRPEHVPAAQENEYDRQQRDQ